MSVRTDDNLSQETQLRLWSNEPRDSAETAKQEETEPRDSAETVKQEETEPRDSAETMQQEELNQ